MAKRRFQIGIIGSVADSKYSKLIEKTAEEATKKMLRLVKK